MRATFNLPDISGELEVSERFLYSGLKQRIEDMVQAELAEPVVMEARIDEPGMLSKAWAATKNFFTEPL